jgi:hypothetical protein
LKVPVYGPVSALVALVVSIAASQSMTRWLHNLGPMSRQGITVEVSNGAKPFTSWPGRKAREEGLVVHSSSSDLNNSHQAPSLIGSIL